MTEDERWAVTSSKRIRHICKNEQANDLFKIDKLPNIAFFDQGREEPCPFCNEEIPNFIKLRASIL